MIEMQHDRHPDQECAAEQGWCDESHAGILTLNYARERRIAKYSVSARSNGMLVSSGT